MLPKIHTCKEHNATSHIGYPGCPIVNDCNSHTEKNISGFIDETLQK